MPATRHFAAHGSFSLQRSGSVFVLDAQGPWNLETFEGYVRAATPRNEQRRCPFGGYVVVAGEALVTPEIVPDWRESNARLADAGLSAVAYHFLDAAARSFYQDVFRSALGDAPFRFCFVESREAAFAWLAESGFLPA